MSDGSCPDTFLDEVSCPKVLASELANAMPQGETLISPPAFYAATHERSPYGSGAQTAGVIS